MATPVDPPNGIRALGKHYYSMWQTLFEIDTKYVPIKPIGRGAYCIVCSSINRETNEKVAIQKIHNAFENRIDALRTLRELKLLRHLRHDNVIALKDVMMPIQRRTFKDVYMVYELMDTDLHQIIKSSQALTNDHCQYFLFQVYLSANGIDIMDEHLLLLIFSKFFLQNDQSLLGRFYSIESKCWKVCEWLKSFWLRFV